LLPPGGTNPNPEAPTTTPLVSEPGCVAGNRTGPVFYLIGKYENKNNRYFGKIDYILYIFIF